MTRMISVEARQACSPLVRSVVGWQVPFLKLYSEYCLQYDKFINELKKMLTSDEAISWLRVRLLFSCRSMFCLRLAAD